MVQTGFSHCNKTEQSCNYEWEAADGWWEHVITDQAVTWLWLWLCVWECACVCVRMCVWERDTWELTTPPSSVTTATWRVTQDEGTSTSAGPPTSAVQVCVPQTTTTTCLLLQILPAASQWNVTRLNQVFVTGSHSLIASVPNKVKKTNLSVQLKYKLIGGTTTCRRKQAVSLSLVQSH